MVILILILCMFIQKYMLSSFRFTFDTKFEKKLPEIVQSLHISSVALLLCLSSYAPLVPIYIWKNPFSTILNRCNKANIENFISKCG